MIPVFYQRELEILGQFVERERGNGGLFFGKSLTMNLTVKVTSGRGRIQLLLHGSSLPLSLCVKSVNVTLRLSGVRGRG